jgi:hypothetical protein
MSSGACDRKRHLGVDFVIWEGLSSPIQRRRAIRPIACALCAGHATKFYPA